MGTIGRTVVAEVKRLLSPFTAHKARGWEIHNQWCSNGWRYATDSVIGVRVRTDEPDSKYLGPRIPRLDLNFNPLMNTEGFMGRFSPHYVPCNVGRGWIAEHYIYLIQHLPDVKIRHMENKSLFKFTAAGLVGQGIVMHITDED